jgi:phospholipid/cholesterol/gamma-HCH transport system ATP-binding protein
MAAPLIRLEQVCKQFNGQQVLTHLDLTVKKGSSLVIVGSSGAGKSVLLKCMVGIIPYESGKIYHDQQEVQEETPQMRNKRLDHTGVVFQQSALFEHMNLWENVAFGNFEKTESFSKHLERECCDLLEIMGIDGCHHHKSPTEISGGMQRRVAIARAMIRRPYALFFDEPTSGLDPIFSEKISHLIRHCIQSLQATTVTITHDLKSASIIADEIALLHQGRIVWQGTFQEIPSSTHPLVQRFFKSYLLSK